MRTALSLLLALIGGAGPVAAQESGALTVFAAASLSTAFEELGDLFERENPGAVVRFNFAGSQQLALQLEHGARADLYASADVRWMRYAAERGLLAAAPRFFARNRLVVVVRAGGSPAPRRLQDLALPGTKLVLAAQAVPAGAYSREALARMERAPGFPPGFARRVLANLVSEEENVRAVVAKVQLGEADAGMVYASDARGRAVPRLTVIEIPEAWNALAEYPVAPLRDARAPSLAEAFLRVVLGAEGQRILERHGFVPATSPPRTVAPGAAR
jgi:molybdate transport system substrate-binding protein